MLYSLYKLNFTLFTLFFISFCQISFGQSAEDFLKSGNQKFKENQYLEAKKDYEKAIQLNPKLAKAQHNLGEILYLLGDYEAALQHFNQAIELNPQNPESYCSRASIYMGMRKMKEAQTDVDKAIQLSPNFANAHYISGLIKFSKNQKSEACQDWKQALSFGHPEARKKIEKNCAGLVTLPPIKEEVEKNNPKKSPETANQFLHEGEKKMEKREYDLAIQAFQKAIELDPEYAEAYFGLAGAQFAKGDHEGACQNWRKSHQLGYKKAKEMWEGVCNE